jgi:signal transduction histidine kinase
MYRTESPDHITATGLKTIHPTLKIEKKAIMKTQKESVHRMPDPTEERLARFEARQQELEEENKRLHTMLAETRYWSLRSQEEERSKLARDLHGGPIQELSSLLFEINILERMLDDEDCTAVVVGLRENLKSSIRSLRKFINALHPPALSHFGLQPAIRSYVEQLQAEHVDLKIALVLNSEERLPNSEVEWMLYRVLQQIVQNVVDHAQARNLLIRLRIDEHEIRLEVEDDGIGFQAPAQNTDLLTQEQMGLFTVRMRIETFGGALKIRSAPGQGTAIQVMIPRTS